VSFPNELAYQLVYNNPLINKYYQVKRRKVLTKDFLLSDAYNQIFLKYVEDDSSYKKFLNDAEDKTRNFRYRHYKIQKILGCWRWKAFWQFRDELIPLFFNPDKTCVDFGGANGPVSFDAVIVDFFNKDIFGRKVIYKSLDEVDFQADCIVSSHTLEHIKDLDSTINKLYDLIKPKGDLILNLPAYSCKRWRSGIHTHKEFNDHAWTFYLKETQLEEDFVNPLAIDQILENNFRIKNKTYVGDNSIFLHLTK